jgi:hypothetical protein
MFALVCGTKNSQLNFIRQGESEYSQYLHFLQARLSIFITFQSFLSHAHPINSFSISTRMSSIGHHALLSYIRLDAMASIISHIIIILAAIGILYQTNLLKSWTFTDFQAFIQFTNWTNLRSGFQFFE